MNNKHRVAYKRVSTGEQSTARQLDGMEFDAVFEDKISGSTKERPQLQLCLSHLRKGDELYIHSIDRLARNLVDLCSIVNDLVDRGISIHFVTDNLHFNGEDNLMSEFTLHILGAFAQFERKMIKKRQREGIDIAKAKGKHLGRPKLNLSIANEVKKLRNMGETIQGLATKFEVSIPSIYKLLRC